MSDCSEDGQEREARERGTGQHPLELLEGYREKEEAWLP